MSELQKFTKSIEYLFLKRIIEGLKYNQLTIPQAKSFAQAFLKLEPFTSIEDARDKMSNFAAKNYYFKSVGEYVNSYHKEKQTGRLVEQMRKHLKNNNVAKALQVVGR